jgi:hypothetical protein
MDIDEQHAVRRHPFGIRNAQIAGVCPPIIRRSGHPAKFGVGYTGADHHRGTIGVLDELLMRKLYLLRDTPLNWTMASRGQQQESPMKYDAEPRRSNDPKQLRAGSLRNPNLLRSPRPGHASHNARRSQGRHTEWKLAPDDAHAPFTSTDHRTPMEESNERFSDIGIGLRTPHLGFDDFGWSARSTKLVCTAERPYYLNQLGNGPLMSADGWRAILTTR